MLKRYWRKPINLNRRFHAGKVKRSFTKNYAHFRDCPAVHGFVVDRSQLKEYRTIFLDYHMLNKDRELPSANQWLLKHARKFRPLSDEESPFVKGVAEFLFSADINKLSNLP